jgi:uncharacterized SAM-binding protein YcdF (DUF218 family)
MTLSSSQKQDYTPMEFIISKILWVLCAPGNLLLLLMLVGGLMGVSRNKTRSQRGRLLSFDISLLLLALSILPVGQWLLLPLENAYPAAKPNHVDGIILLGGDEKAAISEARSMPIALNSSRRYIGFAALAREYPKAKLVFSGGTSPFEPYSIMKDAEVARAALKSLGVPVEQMVFEDESHNTHENAVLTAAVLKPTSQQNWLLVTSAFHMPRSIGCFRKVGFTVYPAPVGYMTKGYFSLRPGFDMLRHLTDLSYALHEYVGLIAYWVMGYSVAPWTK